MNVSKLNLLSVTATTEYRDSAFHPLSNFVFEYHFDKSGRVIYRKYWRTDLAKGAGNPLYVKLIVDSAIVDSSNRLYYGNIGESAKVKFNQHKDRDENYIRNTFDKLKTINATKERFRISVDAREFLIDTVLLSRNVCIPDWLIPSGDSLTLINDTIKIFTKSDSSLFLSAKCFIAETGEIEIDWTLQDYQGVWRSYYIDKSGLLYKQKQNIFSTLYFYNADRLHVKTETYQYEFRTTRTTFKYKTGNR